MSNAMPVVQSYQKVRNVFRTFARNFACIETKQPKQPVLWGLSCPERPKDAECWEFNDGQNVLDFAINKMLAELGWVRIIIVKGRQQGISTYIELRFLWLSLFNPNTKICIIAHDDGTAISLFRKATFAHENLPDGLRPTLKTSNRKELVFANNHSNYLVLTAGSEEAGRGQTAHHQHQSERAKYKNASAVDAGAGQIVGLEPGTEVYQEYTGNGMNHCYFEVLDALKGKGNFRIVFIPWYWEKRYRSTPKPGFKRDAEEIELINRFGKNGLTDDEQLQWRRDKIVELKTLKKFREEYPNYLMEAFQASGDRFYDGDLVSQAQKRAEKLPANRFGAIIIGVDPGREGDRTIIAIRQGDYVAPLIKYDTMDSQRLAGIVGNLIDELDADKVFIDWGMGHGTIDRLWERGYRGIVEGVNFGGSSDDPTYLNKRAEMNYLCRDWLMEGEPKLPDDDDMAADFAMLPEAVPTGSGKMKFPSKEELKKEHRRSPDILDAIVATFAYPVRPRKKDGVMNQEGGQSKLNVVRSELTTQNRRYEAMEDGGFDGRRGRFNTKQYP